MVLLPIPNNQKDILFVDLRNFTNTHGSRWDHFNPNPMGHPTTVKVENYTINRDIAVLSPYYFSNTATKLVYQSGDINVKTF